MNPETITHATLRELAQAGAVRQASAVAFGDRWAIVVAYGGVQKTLAARNSRQIRSWANLNSVVKYLAELGIRKFDTDATNYDPSQKTIERPDKSITLKRAHEAAAHRKWFREQVTATREAGHAPLSQAEAKAETEKRMTEKYGPRT
jgi:hypothetical protein